MEQYQIEDPSNSDIAEDIRQTQSAFSKSQNTAETEKTQDKIDLINCLLTSIFKCLSIAFYLLLKLLTDISLGTFIGTVLLVSFDFWVTKNLTGRKLVGLRWWSQLTDDDEQQWVFESRNPNREPHSFNESIFWFSQFIFSLFWVIIFLINFITLSLFWIGLGFFTSLLGLINLYCYFKCRGQHQKKVWRPAWVSTLLISLLINIILFYGVSRNGKIRFSISMDKVYPSFYQKADKILPMANSIIPINQYTHSTIYLLIN